MILNQFNPYVRQLSSFLWFLAVLSVLTLVSALMVNPWPSPDIVSDAELGLLEKYSSEDSGACTGKYHYRRTPSDNDLHEIIREHEKWIANQNEGARANFCTADLHMKIFRDADLRGAIFTRANLTDATFIEVNLSSASFNSANLTNANFTDANLSLARLVSADLTNAVLFHVNLTKADLLGTKMLGANLYYTDMHLVSLDLVPGSLPTVSSLSSSEHLATIRYLTSPLSMQELRESFKRGGMREQERAMTYAIKRSERLRMQPVERLFSWLLFDVTTHYGMSPGNALRWLAILIVAFSIPYMVAIGFPLKAGIWAIWSKDRICKEDGNELPARVTQDFLFPSARSKWWGPGALTRLLLGSFYFSVLSAFSLGWRDLNVGAWISRLQPREYFLRGTGWARVISGIQSLISVYLLTMWFITYFGRPFE